jgi:hypothetical protein
MPESLPDSAPDLLSHAPLTAGFNGFGALDLKGVGITYSGFVDQILKAPAIRNRFFDLGDEFIGNIEAKPLSFASAAESIAGMALSALADRAVLANAGTPAQGQRARCNGP